MTTLLLAELEERKRQAIRAQEETARQDLEEAARRPGFLRRLFGGGRADSGVPVPARSVEPPTTVMDNFS